MIQPVYKPSAKAKRITIKISKHDLSITVVYPYGTSLSSAKKFFQEKQSWVKKTLSRLNQEVSPRKKYQLNETLKTKFHTLKIIPADNNQTNIQLDYTDDSKEFHILIPKNIKILNDTSQTIIKHFLIEIYRYEAQMYLPERIAYLARKHGFSYNKITIRNQKTRWGSCSYQNNISLNLQLMKLSDELIDYVILHELCHTIEKNHSTKFWKLLESHLPNCKALDKKLKAYSTTL